MTDIATLWDTPSGTGDWAFNPPEHANWADEAGNKLSSGLDLHTAALISLFTDRAADPDDVIPDGSDDPRGWWASPEMGSKLWLRNRSKATPSLPALIKNDIEQALAWFVTDGVCASIEVAVEYEGPSMIAGLIVFRRQDGARLAIRFSRLWESI